ncbi:MULTISPECIES: alpha/beta hydrolase [unclassified Leucobacter]|uniref:alpha/beta hydrolase n=1 Tax=unclassified Leucobacter TaxID=2621730 RepID=UPI00165D5D17|nr:MULTISPECIES: alpha/beta hydrolase [unclassified Leucobacter]MBC9926538.1 alpha/beta hydrolase [Leucobacter sp. cx-169]
MSFDVADDSTNEFRFLASDAAGVGLSGPLPEVRRVSVPLPDGRQLSALRYGDEHEAPEFVLLHGMGLNAHSFDPTALALGRPALAIDLAGHGRSDWRTDANYRPDLLAQDIVVALDALAPGPVALVGHSLGALTSIVVAALRPDAVRILVIVDLTPGVTPASDAAGITEFIAGQRAFNTIDEIVDRAVQFGIGSDRTALTRGVALNTRLRADGKLEWTHHFAHLLQDPNNPAEVEAAANAAREAGSTPADPTQPYAGLWAPLEEFAAPVSLIRGTTGMVSDAMLAEWRRRLPRAADFDLDTGHNVHEQDPVGLARLLTGIAQQVTDR